MGPCVEQAKRYQCGRAQRAPVRIHAQWPPKPTTLEYDPVTGEPTHVRWGRDDLTNFCEGRLERMIGE